MESYHLDRYVERAGVPYNERFRKDADQFVTVLRRIVGRRITYQQLIDLIGKAAWYGAGYDVSDRGETPRKAGDGRRCHIHAPR